MGLWDSASNFFSGGARNDMDKGYKEADQYFAPYQQGGVADYNHMRDYASRWGNNLDSYGNPGDYAYKRINQSPNQYYDEIMHGYSESPEAKYEQEQALKASNAAGSASGMVGSGAFTKAIQQNAADISNRDRDRYYGNVMRSRDAQMESLQNFQNQQMMHRQMMQYLTGLGYGAGTNMAQNRINRAQSDANYDQGAFNDMAGIAGGAARYFGI
jgi:hypothetical protein